jgi:pimeloyl-ACP methyl ester carboxylesterase
LWKELRAAFPEEPAEPRQVGDQEVDVADLDHRLRSLVGKIGGMSESGFIPVSGGRLYYEESGEGPPLVLLHAGVANLRQWDPHVPAFAERYRVIRYDSRGYGRSESEHLEFSNHGDLEQVLDYLGVQATHLLGTSRSGSIALNFSVTHPERVTSLTVVASGAGEPDLPAEALAPGEALDKATEEALEAKDWTRLADLETAFWGDGPDQPQGRLNASARASMHDWILTTYAAEKEEGIPQRLDPPADERLDQLTMPLLVVIGALDEAYTNASGRILADAVAGSRFEVFEGAAHMLNLEQPERFTRLVLDFLAEADAV